MQIQDGFEKLRNVSKTAIGVDLFQMGLCETKWIFNVLLVGPVEQLRRAAPHSLIGAIGLSMSARLLLNPYSVFPIWFRSG